METAVCKMPTYVYDPAEVGTIGAFFEPSVASEKNLRRSEQELVRELVAVLDKQLLKVIDSRSKTEFATTRDSVWPRYVRALRALHDTVANLVPDNVYEMISHAVIDDLSADLQQEGSQRLGGKVIEQSIFTLWTMQRIRQLGREIVDAGKLPPKYRSKDKALFEEYYGTSLWAQFHLDMVFCALKFDRPLCEDIHDLICDGLRASVNAYAVMKDALRLRQPSVEDTAIENLPWDEEDDELLASSMEPDASPHRLN
jgi:hypothetical protein